MTLPNGTGVPVLRPSLCVSGWIMHPLSKMDAVNGLAWTRESLMLDKNPGGWMFRMSWWDDQHMGQFPTDVSKQVKMVELSRDMGWHHDAWACMRRCWLVDDWTCTNKWRVWPNKLGFRTSDVWLVKTNFTQGPTKPQSEKWIWGLSYP